MDTERVPVVAEDDPHCPFAPVQWIPRPTPPQIFCVPRRYDLATLMAVTLAYACLFGGMRACGAPAELVVWTAGLLTAVGFAQAFLFRGQSPRAASMVGGIAFFCVGFAVISILEGWRLPNRSAGSIVSYVVLQFTGVAIHGALLGYLAGVVVAGVFLVAHYLRRGKSRLAR